MTVSKKPPLFPTMIHMRSLSHLFMACNIGLSNVSLAQVQILVDCNLVIYCVGTRACFRQLRERYNK